METHDDRPGATPRRAALTSFRGSLVSAADPGYEEARPVYNAMIDRRPALLARCRDVADVIAAVNFGRASGLDIAVRGGTHNGAGFGAHDDGAGLIGPVPSEPVTGRIARAVCG